MHLTWATIAAAATFGATLVHVALGQADADPCAGMVASREYLFGGGELYMMNASEVLGCYNSFAVTPDTRKLQVEALKLLLAFYPYYDIEKGSTSPYYESNYDLGAALDNIGASDAIVNEFDLQTLIQSSLNLLYDAHVSYQPTCFTTARLVQPFVLAAKFNSDGPPTIYVKSLQDETYYFTAGDADMSSRLSDGLASFYGNLSWYVGLEVTEINGFDAVTYLQSVADDLGAVKDRQSRFNRVVARAAYLNGAHGDSAGAYFATSVASPDMAVPVEYTFKTGDKYSAQWAGFVTRSKAFSDRDSYYQAFCVPAGQDTATPDQPGEDDLDRFDPGSKIPSTHFSDRSFDATKLAFHFQQHMDSLRQRVNGKAVIAEDLGLISTSTVDLNSVEPLIHDYSSAFYMLDASTGVWIWSSLEGLRGNDTIESMMATISAGLLALQSNGATTLIIDTIGNGGGYLCLAEIAFYYLFNDDTPLMAYDARLPSAAEAFYKVADLTPEVSKAAGVLTFHNKVPLTPNAASPLDNPQTITRGGVTETYTDKFTLDCSDPLLNVKDNVPQLTNSWDPTKVFILSDGSCGSACGMFLRTARDRLGVKALVVGGGGTSPAGTPPLQPSAFEGSNVIKFADIVKVIDAVAQAANVSDDVAALFAVLPFPLPVAGQIPTHDSYSLDSEVRLSYPAEWVPEPADARLDVEDVTDRVAMWMAAAKFAEQRA